MKIIDLAEKQLNNEILPKHIRYNNEDLYLDGVSYCDKQGNNDLLDILARENSAITHLYDEVEIIEESEENTKIEKLQLIYNDIIYGTNFNRDILTYCDNLQVKINELIDEINNLKEEK